MKHGQITAPTNSKNPPTFSIINMPHKHVEVSQIGFQGVSHDDHDHLKLHRLYDERPADKSHYMMTWIGSIDAGRPILGHFFGPTVMYIIEGEFHLDEKNKPEVTKLVAGDVLHIDEDSYIKWTSPSHGKAFAVCYAPVSAHPDDIAKPFSDEPPVNPPV